MTAEIHALVHSQVCNKPANPLDTYMQVSHVTHSPHSWGHCSQAVPTPSRQYPTQVQIGEAASPGVGRTGWERSWQVGRGHRVRSPNERREDVPTQVAAQAPFSP